MKIRYLLLVLWLIVALVTALDAQTDAKTYADEAQHFTVSYPADFRVVAKPAADGGLFDDEVLGTKVFKAVATKIPKKYQGTVVLEIWVSSNANAKCGEADAADEPDSIAKTKMIGGKTFYGYSDSSGGMGGSSYLSAYRGMVKGKCWQLRMISAQSKLTASGEDVVPTPFDPKILEKTLYNFVDSFKYTGK